MKRFQRFLTAFDWKLVIGLCVLTALLLVTLGKVQDMRSVNDSRSQAKKSQQAVATLTRLVERQNADAEDRSKTATKDRNDLLKKIDRLTKILVANGLTIPDNAKVTPGTVSRRDSGVPADSSPAPSGDLREAAATPRSGGTKSSSGGGSKSAGGKASGGGQSSGGGGSSGGGSTGGGNPGGGSSGGSGGGSGSGGGRGNEGLLTPVTGLPLVCNLLGSCPDPS